MALGTLRFLLAIAVAGGHSPYGYQFVEGTTAVKGFFIISGLFITIVLCENPAYQDTPRFYVSRYLRLWPMYIVCAVPTLLLSSANPFSFGDQSISYADAFKTARCNRKILRAVFQPDDVLPGVDAVPAGQLADGRAFLHLRLQRRHHADHVQ